MRTYLICVRVLVIVFAPFLFSVYVNTDSATRSIIWSQMIILTGTIGPDNWDIILIHIAMLIAIPYVIRLVIIIGSGILGTGHDVVISWLTQSKLSQLDKKSCILEITVWTEYDGTPNEKFPLIHWNSAQLKFHHIRSLHSHFIKTLGLSDWAGNQVHEVLYREG